MNFKKISIMLMLSLTVWAQSATPAAGAPKDRDEAAFHYHMGLNYYDGLGEPPDYAKAVDHFKRAATLNHSQAQGMLGQCYRNGRGVNKDRAKAAHWIQRAAQHEDPIAHFLYGTLLATGEGVPRDPAQALRFYLKAAAKGHAAAMNNIGALHEQGHGVPQNFTEAAKWYQMAARMNLANAQCNLGQLYASGRGVPLNTAAATEWYAKAAQQGHPRSQFLLGAAYYFGKGVPRDLVKAYQWMDLSANLGNPAARQHRTAIAEKLSPEQAQQAFRESSKFRAKFAGAEADSTQTALSTGTGFFISAEGHLLTSHHLIANGRRIEVRTQKGNFPAELIKADPGNDLALLRIKTESTPLRLSALPSARLGQSVFTLGYPNPAVQGIKLKFTEGRISSLTGVKDDPRMMQISVPVQPGNSGGALVNETGQVVGMITVRLDDLKTFRLTGSLPQNVNYALKSSQIHAFLATLPLVKSRLPAPQLTATANYEAHIEIAQAATAFVLVHE